MLYEIKICESCIHSNKLIAINTNDKFQNLQIVCFYMKVQLAPAKINKHMSKWKQLMNFYLMILLPHGSDPMWLPSEQGISQRRKFLFRFRFRSKFTKFLFRANQVYCC